MNWRSLFLIAAIPLLLPIGSSLARPESPSAFPALMAQRPFGPPTGDGEMRGEGREPRLPEELNLTTEQSQRIQAIQEQSKAARESLHQQLQAAEEQMRSLLAGNATADQLRQQHQQLQNLRQQLGNQHFETMLAIREILTPQQRAQMAELRGQHQGRRGNRPGS
jgi:periplasmic protein CpxP/Spy